MEERRELTKEEIHRLAQFFKLLMQTDQELKQAKAEQDKEV